MRRPSAFTVLQAAVSLGSLAAVVWWATRQEPPSLPDTTGRIAALAGALAVYALATAVRGERWHRILRANGVAVERGDSYRLTTVGYMGNNVLPARAGDLMRALLLGPRTATPRREILGSVIAERALDAAALSVVFAAGLASVQADTGVSRARVAVLALAVATVAAAAALLVLLARHVGAVERIRLFLRPLALATRRLAGRHGARLLVLSLAIWALEASVYLLVGYAAELRLGFPGALYVVGLTNLFALVPAGPGYVGTFDAAVLLGVRSLGHPGSDAVAYLLLLRFVLFVPITLVGLAFFLARYRALRDAAGSPEPALAVRRPPSGS